MKTMSAVSKLAVVGWGALSVVACGGGSSGAEPKTAATEQGSAASDAPSAPSFPPAQNAGQPITTAMIDDLEDGNAQIGLSDGRGGYWYTYKDSGSTIEPGDPFSVAEGGAKGSKFAARMSGSIGDAEQYPYAGMGFAFVEPKAAYDISSCEGISFMAKKGSAESQSMLRMKVGDANTVPEGGVCKDCFNDFGRDVLLSEEWTEVRAPFYEMKQEPYWGEPKPKFVASNAYQIQFQVKERGAFDIWVDDVQLFGCK